MFELKTILFTILLVRINKYILLKHKFELKTILFITVPVRINNHIIYSALICNS